MDIPDARCRDDQVEACRTAVGGNSLSTFNNGGECEAGKYDIYDQICSLNHFTPGVDYCCCAHGRKALCCRFHFNHKYFRCDEEADTINVPLSLTTTIIISAVVCAVVAIIAITIIVKCVKGRRAMDKQSSSRSSTSRTKPSDDQSGFSAVSQTPDTYTTPGEGNNNGHVTPINGLSRAEPSAPPDEEFEQPADLPSYDRAVSEPADMHVTPTPLHGADHPMFRLDSDVPEARTRLLSGGDPPPAYDQHQNDPRWHPEMNGNQAPRHEWF